MRWLSGRAVLGLASWEGSGVDGGSWEGQLALMLLGRGPSSCGCCLLPLDSKLDSQPHVENSPNLVLKPRVLSVQRMLTPEGNLCLICVSLNPYNKPGSPSASPSYRRGGCRESRGSG